MLVDGAMALRRTHCPRKSCYTSVKRFTHKHIDMGRLPALAALVVSREKTMEEIKPAFEQQRLSAVNLFAIAQRKIDEATRRGAASVQIILPTGYDDEAVEDLICYLDVRQYYVKWYHGTDCLEMSWKWHDIKTVHDKQ